MVICQWSSEDGAPGAAVLRIRPVGSRPQARFQRSSSDKNPACTYCSNGVNGFTDLTDRTAEFTPDAGSIDVVTGFGEGGDGSLYLVDWLDGELFAVPEPAGTPVGAVAFAALWLLTRSARCASGQHHTSRQLPR